MEISFDDKKRDKTLIERGLDFKDAVNIFSGVYFTLEDDRYDYKETRFITYGYLNKRLVMIAYTNTEDGIRVISMRKCNDKEQRRFKEQLGRFT